MKDGFEFDPDLVGVFYSNDYLNHTTEGFSLCSLWSFVFFVLQKNDGAQSTRRTTKETKH